MRVKGIFVITTGNSGIFVIFSYLFKYVFTYLQYIKNQIFTQIFTNAGYSEAMAPASPPQPVWPSAGASTLNV